MARAAPVGFAALPTLSDIDRSFSDEDSDSNSDSNSDRTAAEGGLAPIRPCRRRRLLVAAIASLLTAAAATLWKLQSPAATLWKLQYGEPPWQGSWRDFGEDIEYAVQKHTVSNVAVVTWQGWGVALSWWANLFGDDTDVADLVFTMRSVTLGSKSELKDLPGLGLNVVRYNVGGCVGAQRDGANDPPARIKTDNGFITMGTEDMVDYKRIQGFWMDWFNEDPASDSWNWNTDHKQINMLKLARGRGANIIELFSNSPMWWMTDSHHPAGNKKYNESNLPGRNENKFAYYLAQVAKYFRVHHDIQFHTVSPFNEPRGNEYGCWWTSGPTTVGQEGNCMFVRQQGTVIKALRAELDKVGLEEVVISASEENTFNMAKRTWQQLDTDSKALIGQLNVHGYSELCGDRVFLRETAASEKKRLWMSEYSDNDRWNEGASSHGIRIARTIHYDFEYLGMSAWSYWQVFDNSDGWGLLSFANSAEEGWWGENRNHWSVETKYYVFAHFTRHIRPEMLILKTDSFNQVAHNRASTVAAYSPPERKLVLVTTNFRGRRRVSYELGALTKVDGTCQTWVTHTDGSRKYEKDVSGDFKVGTTFSSDFEPWTVKSFEITGVDL